MTQQFHSWVYIRKKTKTLIRKDTCTFFFFDTCTFNVHSSTMYNSKDVQATQVPTDRGMDKEDVLYISIHKWNTTQP